VRNTPGENDSTRYDDFGCVGVWIMQGDNKITHNTMVQLRCPCLDFVDDGGAVEIFPLREGISIDRILIAWNYARGCDGFLEVGGGPCSEIVVAYNVSIDNGRFILLHTKGKYRVIPDRFYVQHNTVVETGKRRNWAPLLFGGPGPGSGLLVRNNIFALYNIKALSNSSSFDHKRNIWFAPDLKPREFGLKLNSTEAVVWPGFRAFPFDLHLTEDSPAIDSGEYLGETFDYDGTRVPQGVAPDLGAYEYRAGGVLFLRGDINNDGVLSLADALRLSSWLFSGAPTPGCPDSADVNDDGSVDLADMVALLAYLSGNVSSIPPPFGKPGSDPTPDGLGCGRLR